MAKKAAAKKAAAAKADASVRTHKNLANATYALGMDADGIVQFIIANVSSREAKDAAIASLEDGSCIQVAWWSAGQFRGSKRRRPTAAKEDAAAAAVSSDGDDG